MLALADRYVLAAIGNGFGMFNVMTGECLMGRKGAHRGEVTMIMLLYNGCEK